MVASSLQRLPREDTMSVSATSATQNISSTLLQQLLSGSNAQATSSLSPTVLKAVLASASSETQSAQAPDAVTQALGDLLSGNNAAGAQGDLSQLQSYFKQNPDKLTSLLSSLQNTGTYSASGTVSSASTSLLAALGLDTSGNSSSSSSIIFSARYIVHIKRFSGGAQNRSLNAEWTVCSVR